MVTALTLSHIDRWAIGTPNAGLHRLTRVIGENSRSCYRDVRITTVPFHECARQSRRATRCEFRRVVPQTSLNSLARTREVPFNAIGQDLPGVSDLSDVERLHPGLRYDTVRRGSGARAVIFSPETAIV